MRRQDGTAASLSSDPTGTALRIATLDNYLQSAVLSDEHFCCASYAGCRASHPGAFYEGQLHHVGHHYGLSVGGVPLRVVVVGQEYGKGPARVSLAKRHEMILYFGTERRFRREPGFIGRKSHLRGTTSLLRALFGHRLGTDHAGEFIHLPTGRVHIFDAFALVNFLLCSAVDVETDTDVGDAFYRYQRRGGQRGRSSRVMVRNCARHFRRVLEILEPTVIVAQGRGVRRWMANVLDHTEPAHAVLPLERVVFGSCRALLASFTHPSAPSRENWGMNAAQPYLLDVVVPTVEAARLASANR